MKTRFEFTDVLNEYVKRENRSAGQLNRLTGIHTRTIENWLKGHSGRARNWHDVVKLAKALHLSPAETDKLLRAAGHPAIEELWDLADAEDIKVLEQLSSTFGAGSPTNAPNYGPTPAFQVNIERQYNAKRDQYNADTINIGTDSSSRQRRPLAETRVSLARQGATGDTFQQLDAIEREIKKGTRADIRELGQLLNQFEQDEVVDDNIYSQLLEEIQMGFPDASQSVLSSIRKRRERLYYDGR